jgi:hypothetical protein
VSKVEEEANGVFWRQSIITAASCGQMSGIFVVVVVVVIVVGDPSKINDSLLASTY